MKRISIMILLAVFLPMAVSSPCFAQTVVEMYKSSNCIGDDHLSFETGDKESSLQPNWHDQVKSVKVLKSCCKVILYEYPDYREDGDTWTVYKEDGCFARSFGDGVSGYKVLSDYFDATGLNKTKGNTGDTFKISGKGFKDPGIRSVEIRGSSLNSSPLSDTELEVTIGTKSGKVTVESRHGCRITINEEFTACPKITSLTVTDTVLPDDKFKINGKGFVDVRDVKIGDEFVDFKTLSSTEIEVTVGEKTGKVTVITDECSVASSQDVTVPGFGFTYYDISGTKIDGTDQNMIEKNAVKRVDEREGKTEYRLEMDHDPSAPPSSSGYMENFGNPSPKTGKYWYTAEKSVSIRIDGIVYESARDTRHVCTGYTLSRESGGNFVDDFVRKSPQDEHSFNLRMDGPKKIFFRWKNEYSFQVMSMPAAMGDNLTPKAGTYWYDADTTVTSSASNGCLQVTGYRDNINALTQTMPGKTKTYTMDMPVQITWQYEAHNYEETVIIGDSVTFKGIPSAVLGRTDTESEPVRPTSADPSQVDQGAEELYHWSISDRKLFPLIGGQTFQVEWQSRSGSQCEQKLISTIHTQWPETPHYVHVADTPPVPLDPQEDDRFAFKSLKYTSNEAEVSQALEFTASKEGKSTLLLTTVPSGAATGDENVENAYVRVVETRLWTKDKEEGTAEIGLELTSEHHSPDTPHNGYVFWDRARYNVNIYDRETMQGQIFPVNRQFTSALEDNLVVVWYQIIDNISWPYQPVQYISQWPTNEKEEAAGEERITSRIVIASREGSECAIECDCGEGGSECEDEQKTYPTWPDRNGTEQEYLDPARYKDVMIYQQPDPDLPGYNPNEEHAVTAPSFRHGKMASPPVAAFALRDDLNITAKDKTHTSENYVLLQYYDTIESKYAMEVFDIEKEDDNCGYKFEYPMRAGDPVVAPYPLNLVIGAAPPSEICGRNGNPDRNCYWEDHKGQSWAVSGDAHLFAYFWYPLAPEFWYEKNHNGENASEGPGDPIPWLPDGIVNSESLFPQDMIGKPKAVRVRYNTEWPDEVPILKAGETVTYAGGEYRADHPQTREGLPMVLGWAAGQVIFDDLNPAMDDKKMFHSYLVRLVQALEERAADLPVEDMPEELTPAAGKVKAVGGRWYFKELHAGLKTRIFYDPMTEKLGIRGFVNGKTLGDADLTASPPSVYVLQPNILTQEEWGTLRGMEGANPAFKAAVDALYNLTRDPANLMYGAYTVGLSDARKELQTYHETLFEKQFDDMCGSLHSLCPPCGFDTMCAKIISGDTSGAARPFPEMALGPGLALVPSAKLLDPASDIQDGYVTVAENNHPSLGSLPVALHIVKVVNDKYRGAIKTIESDNVFDEKITLRHTADFGANPGDAEFEWRYREEDGTEQPPPDTAPEGTWSAFPGKEPEIAMEGAGAALLTDNLFFCRYRHKDSDGDDPASWSDWAGAANSRPPKEGEDSSETFQAQLAEGWVKRVMNGLNPFEARINDFYSSDSPATYTSMVRQAGQRFEGAVAFNPAKDVIENVGLIELYQTVLNRAEDLSINLAQAQGSSGVYTALLLAASRIAGFYTLLGNEAYTDALDPTIGFGTDSVDYGSLAPTIFTFMNQVPTLLDEELALLCGRDEEGARPVYNRLIWNFTKAEGEAAYALSYNLADVNKDGFIDEADGRATYPQGHGDAWGHYLSALRGYYDLLNHDYFNWESRSEKFQIEGVVMDVDYFDERKFAETAAAKAKVGREVVNLTYRSKYVEDPDGQWQGYRDTDLNRAWGLEGWGRRAMTGALIDWAVANAILPASVAFKLTKEDMDRLKREGIPQGVTDKLGSPVMNRSYPTKDEFMAAAKGMIGENAFEEYAPLLSDLDIAVGNVFKLTQAGTDWLIKEGVPQSVIYKLVTPIRDQAYRTEDEFMAALRSSIGEDWASDYGDLVLKIADNNGLKQVDRTTVPDLLEIASQARQIQQEYDHANTGLNPLGLATDVVPFDIDPARTIPGAYNAATQFEQVYERAVKAMDNARAVFDHANDLKNRIRQVANDTEEFTEQVIDQDRDYRNRLIETFGTPYEGTIGSGKVYPAGYKGPDYFLYMYIDVNEVSEETVPQPSDTIKAYFSPMDKKFEKMKDESGEGDFSENKTMTTVYQHFFDADLEDVPSSATEDGVTPTDFEDAVMEVDIPISTGKYSFQTPAEWGMRRSPGEIQQALIELVKAEADLQLAMADYAGLMLDIENATEVLQARSDLNAEELRIGDEWASDVKLYNGLIIGLNKTAQAAEAAADYVWDHCQATVEVLPKVAGTSNDTTSGMRAAHLFGGIMISGAIKTASLGVETDAEVVESKKELTEIDKDTKLQKAEYKYDIQQQLQEIEALMGNEAPGRMEIFRRRENMRQVSEKYRAVLAKGLRLMEERKAFNAKVAAKTQGKRYMDMAFRLNLNGALSKYRSMFDLASRYSYLAAKAYDYETNLSDRDPASAKPLLTDIVRQRTLGQYEGDRYVVGRGGLGDILARMEANFASLKGQMGFNNPQTETGRFSLRHEKFRIGREPDHDDDWRAELQKCRVSDLWAVPEFRKFCRPFTQEDAGFQPGLVIDFTSNVIFGKNFFGWPLGGGDHAYDPTNFATKVRSVGLWFEGYDNSQLSETPRAYLIPAGMDVMLVPNSTDLDSREWTVVDQKLPVPLPVGDSDLNNPDWIPSLDSLDGPMTQIRRYSSFRAYHDSGYFDQNQVSYDSRLIGRSVWNTRWVLIIPGGTFHYDTNQGLDTFIDTVTDIKLFFQTYAMSGGKK